MAAATLRDLLRLALPPGTMLLTGVEGLDYTIHAALGVTGCDCLPALRGGELVVVDHPVTLRDLASRPRPGPEVALAVIGDVPADVRELVESAGLPLVQLPPSATPEPVVREVDRLLAAPDLQLERRASQLFGELTGYIARGEGIDRMLTALHTATRHTVALYDAAGELSATWHTADEHAVPAVLGRPAAPGPGERASGPIIRAITHAIGPDRVAVMYGSIALYGADLDAWDEAAIEQAADALLLEFAKQQAIQAIETRAGSELLDDIVNRLPERPRQLEEHARELGYDLSRPYVALAIAPADTATSLSSIRARLGRELQLEHTAALFIRQGDIVLCFYPADDASTRPRALLEAVNRDLAIDAGISEPAPTITGWSSAYSDADRALKLGRHLFGSRHLTLYADVRLYSLLYELRASPDLWTFYHAWLDRLLDFDRQHETSLLETLHGYFGAQGNLSLAAERLHIHRNTLIRRLRRVGELTGISLDHTEDALALQVALQAHRVLSIPDHDRVPV